MDTEDQTSTHAERQYFQFTIRTVFALITAAAFLFWSMQDEYIYRWDRASIGLLTFSAVSLALSFRRRRFKSATASCVVAVASILLLLSWKPADPRVGALKPPCVYHLRWLGNALLSYEHAKARFPPAYSSDASGRRLHSWRTLILPFMERSQLSENIRLNEAWNSPHNSSATKVQLDLFQCPADARAMPYDTSYVAIVGPGTIWDPARLGNRHIRDGASNTILLVEFDNSRIKWAEPRDLDLSNLPPGITKQNLAQSLSVHSGGFFALFADGSVRFISSQIPWQDFMALLTENGGETVGPW